ncbi:MAG: hypothetical protein KDK70_16935, partial [Myxococcales bacterium]|nr:hypothetical protein [Myxococcales bacterium]
NRRRRAAVANATSTSSARFPEPTDPDHPGAIMSSITTNTDILTLNGPGFTVDPIAQNALYTTSRYVDDPESPIYDTFLGAASAARDAISTKGWSNYVDQLSTKLNGMNLDDTQRVLLANADIYGRLILRAVEKGGVQASDVSGMVNYITREVRSFARQLFYADMITEVLNYRRISIEAGTTLGQRLAELALDRGIGIRSGQVAGSIDALLDVIYKEGEMPAMVDVYAERGIIAQNNFTGSVRQAMVDYLIGIGANFTIDGVKNGTYDPYFALAYADAQTAHEASDPIDAVNSTGAVSTWNFNVDLFESLEEQGIAPSNIRAAGALDYVFNIGERMMVFDVANALVLRWSRGTLDITEGDTASALYRFYKKRQDRNTPQERAMLYRRVFDVGDIDVGGGTPVNAAFPRYWHVLMTEAVNYIRKAETTSKEDNQVSRASIYQATKDLQYNLSDNMNGMAHLQVTEDYAHLQEAIDIIKRGDILDHFGGRSKSLWNVIETVARDDLGRRVSTSTMRTLATEGNKIFQWIADFNEATVSDERFDAFVASAEAWILARAALDGGGQADDVGGTTDDADSAYDDPLGGGADEFADWND